MLQVLFWCFVCSPDCSTHRPTFLSPESQSVRVGILWNDLINKGGPLVWGSQGVASCSANPLLTILQKALFHSKQSPCHYLHGLTYLPCLQSLCPNYSSSSSSFIPTQGLPACSLSVKQFRPITSQTNLLTQLLTRGQHRTMLYFLMSYLNTWTYPRAEFINLSLPVWKKDINPQRLWGKKAR